MKKVLSNLINVLLIGVFLIACGGAPQAAPTAAQEKILKVGIAVPFTGPNAETGAQLKNAATMALESINFKVGDYKIELVNIDDQSDPQKGTQAYEEAIVGQHIVAGVLGWHSSVAIAQMEVVAKYKIPHFFSMGAAKGVNDKFASDRAKYGYWAAKGWPIPQFTTISYIQTLEDAIKAGQYKPAAKTVAIYGEDTDWGRGVGEGLKKDFTAAGWTIVSEDYFSAEQTDFQALLNRYKDQDVQVLAGTSTFAASMAAFIKQADEIGLKSVIIADGLGWQGNWYELTGNSSNYVVDQIPEFASAKGKQFAADYKARFGTDASPSAAGLGYDWTNFFILILQTALKDYGDITSETIFKVAQEKLWTGQLVYTGGIIMTEYKFTADTIPEPVTGKGYYTFPVRQYHDGSSAIIWPGDIANGKFEAKP